MTRHKDDTEIADLRLLTPAAQRDLSSILDASLSRFGREVTERLLDRMTAALERIERDPGLYRVRRFSDGRPYRCCIVQPFLICYAELNGYVRVLAILHGARDVERAAKGRI
jgi:toxin ParE1/3/4